MVIPDGELCDPIRDPLFIKVTPLPPEKGGLGSQGRSAACDPTSARLRPARVSQPRMFLKAKWWTL
jgi:hypothetical protein